MKDPEEVQVWRRAAVWGCLASGLAVVSLFVLSGLMGAVPGSPVLQRKDVLFNADCGDVVRDYVSDRPIREMGVHPLFHWLYSRPAHYCYLALRTALPEPQAAAIVGRTFNAIVAGAGVGCLVFLALKRGLAPVFLVPLLPVYLLSTAMVLVAVPEHWGISLGLLSATFAIAASELRFGTALALLGLLAILAAGITVTNALFPISATACVVRRHSGGRFASWFLWGGSSAVLLGIAALALYIFSSESRWERFAFRISMFLNRRLSQEPMKASAFVARGLVDPVVGSKPALDKNYLGTWMMTYEPTDAPYRLWPYDLIQTIAAVCWLILLLLSCRSLFRSRHHQLALLLLGWVVFNLLFHNYWGDEFFLFSPHWLWALMATVFLGARSLSLSWVLLLCGLVVIGQVHTLLQFHEVLTAIPV